ncbi:MAG: hypothetical protein ABIT37_23840 [Luteolibacter sp.]
MIRLPNKKRNRETRLNALRQAFPGQWLNPLRCPHRRLGRGRHAPRLRPAGSESQLDPPACEQTLKRTLGIPLFQKQVLRMAMDVAGFTGAEADELRKAMAFKRDDSRMEQVTAKLRLRMGERGITPDVQTKIVDSIGSFALYGFPGEPRHFLRVDCLRVMLAEGPPPGGVLHRSHQQSADGLLLGEHVDPGRQATRHPHVAGVVRVEP